MTGWQPLSRRTLAVSLSWVVPGLASAGLVLVVSGRADRRFWITAAGLVGGFLLVALHGIVVYATTRYRVTPERVELTSGLLSRQRRSVPRDRIRSVDLTAGPVHQLLRLAIVRIGTGQQAGTEELKLDAVPLSVGEELRAELLAGRGGRHEDAPAEGTLARLRGAWLRYAPLTGWSLVIGAIPVGAFFRLLDIVGLNPSEVAAVRDVFGWLGSMPLWSAAAVVLGVVLVLGVLGSYLVYAEMWWKYRLERESSGTLRVRRGLLTTRSLSLEERRLRGVEMVEPVPLRWGSAAELRAIATGTARADSKNAERKDSERDALAPPMPRSETMRIATDVLGSVPPEVFAGEGLTTHPHAALRRRIGWAVAWSVAGAVALQLIASILAIWVDGIPWYTGPIALVVSLPIALLLAYDAYRSLGHRLTDRFLVLRSGGYARRTAVLGRDGVIGWRISRTPFQRRAGLVTIAATTAAGRGAYRAYDTDEAEGVAFAATVTPGLLDQFLAVPAPVGSEQVTDLAQ